MSNSEAIQLNTIDFLVSQRAQLELERLAHTDFSSDPLSVLSQLRAQYTPQEAGALLALVRLREDAGDKFPYADRLFFTHESLQQATPFAVAAYRAQKLAQLAPPGPVLDLGSGIGGDALALAQCRPVLAFERDPLRCRILAANAAAFQPPNPVTAHCDDWQQALDENRLPQAAAAFLDPPRRSEGRRLMRLDQVLPSWTPIERLQERCAIVCIKLMPGIHSDDIPPGAAVEFISHEGVCKEAVIWLGTSDLPQRQAAVHAPAFQEQSTRPAEATDRHAPDCHIPAHWHILVAGGAQPPLGSLTPGEVLYEPDPAVIRAGAFAELCELLDASLLEPQIAYLISNDVDAQARPTPFATAFRIQEIHPYSLRTLNRRLQALNIGTVELKKRGVPFEPESLRPRLHLTPGGNACVVIFTRQGASRIMILAHRITK